MSVFSLIDYWLDTVQTIDWAVRREKLATNRPSKRLWKAFNYLKLKQGEKYSDWEKEQQNIFEELVSPKALVHYNINLPLVLPYDTI